MSCLSGPPAATPRDPVPVMGGQFALNLLRGQWDFLDNPRPSGGCPLFKPLVRVACPPQQYPTPPRATGRRHTGLHRWFPGTGVRPVVYRHPVGIGIGVGGVSHQPRVLVTLHAPPSSIEHHRRRHRLLVWVSGLPCPVLSLFLSASGLSPPRGTSANCTWRAASLSAPRRGGVRKTAPGRAWDPPPAVAPRECPQHGVVAHVGELPRPKCGEWQRAAAAPQVFSPQGWRHVYR